MAKLAAHGKEIGRVDYTDHSIAVFEDGHILKNGGFGWKLWRKLKVPTEAASFLARRIERQREVLAARPALRAYRAELHQMAGLCKRWKLRAALELMPDDPDGVWSEACDGYGDNVSADVSEVANLCRLYKDAIREAAELRDATSAGASIA